MSATETMVITPKLAVNGATIRQPAITISGNSLKTFGETIPAASTGLQFTSLAFTVSQVQGLYWYSDQTVSIGINGTNEVQQLAVDATGGTFTVTYSGQTTSALAYNISAANFQAAMIALSNIGTGDITVTGGPGSSGGGTPYVLTFTGALGNTNVPQITANAGSLTGGGTSATPSTTTAGVAVDETITLTAGKPLVWDGTNYADPFSTATSVSKLSVTNAGASVATIVLYTMTDS